MTDLLDAHRTVSFLLAEWRYALARGDYSLDELDARPAAGTRIAARLDRLTLRLAVDAVRELGEGTRVLVELAGADPGRAMGEVLGALDPAGIDPGCLVVAIPEEILADAPAQIRELLSLARALGCGVALTRFGAGGAGLLGLRGLDIDYIELDAELTRGVGTDPELQAVVHATCGVARALGATVVVRGVNDPETRDVLVELGVDASTCARPTPLSAWPALERALRSEVRV